MNYNRTVTKVMAFLKEKEVCASSRKSHKDCYESLGRFMCQRNETYSALVREDWLLEPMLTTQNDPTTTYCG